MSILREKIKEYKAKTVYNRNMPDYQQSKIYKLWSPQNTLIYIGSTTQPLSKRLADHRKPSHQNKSVTSTVLFENSDNVKIELIEEYPCDNKMQLLKKEGEHIRANNCVNRRIAGRSKKEYAKEYRQNNREKIKDYVQKNQEKLKDYQKVYCQSYREKNRDILLEKAKDYYEKNKDKKNIYTQDNKEHIYEMRHKPYNCECGSVIICCIKARHFKSKKHLNYLESLDKAPASTDEAGTNRLAEKPPPNKPPP